MSEALKALIQNRAGRYIMVQMIDGTVFVGRVVGSYEDGVVLKSAAGRTVALVGQHIRLASDPASELALEEEELRYREALILSRQ